MAGNGRGAICDVEVGISRPSEDQIVALFMKSRSYRGVAGGIPRKGSWHLWNNTPLICIHSSQRCRTAIPTATHPERVRVPVSTVHGEPCFPGAVWSPEKRCWIVSSRLLIYPRWKCSAVTSKTSAKRPVQAGRQKETVSPYNTLYRVELLPTLAEREHPGSCMGDISVRDRRKLSVI